MKPILLHIGSFPVYSYSLLLAVGILVATTLTARRARARGIRPEWIWDIALIGVPTSVLGCRLGYLLFERPDLFANPKEAIAAWHGGMVWYSGLFFGIVVTIRYVLWRGISLGVALDLIAPAFPLAYAFARVGCFLAGCCHGTPMHWGIVLPVLHDGVPRHPTQLYESAACLLLFAFLWSRIDRPRRYDGLLFNLYLVLYAAMRFGVEFLRADDRGGSPFLGLSASQAMAILTIGVVCVIHFIARRNGRPH